VQVGQIIRIDRLLLAHNRCYYRPHYRLRHHLRSLSLQETPDRYVRVHALYGRVVAQHLVSQVLSDTLFNVDGRTLLGGSELVPVLLLLSFGSQLLDLFLVRGEVL
jgi:hypothetical protein